MLFWVWMSRIEYPEVYDDGGGRDKNDPYRYLCLNSCENIMVWITKSKVNQLVNRHMMLKSKLGISKVILITHATLWANAYLRVLRIKYETNKLNQVF